MIGLPLIYRLSWPSYLLLLLFPLVNSCRHTEHTEHTDKRSIVGANNKSEELSRLVSHLTIVTNRQWKCVQQSKNVLQKCSNFEREYKKHIQRSFSPGSTLIVPANGRDDYSFHLGMLDIFAAEFNNCTNGTMLSNSFSKKYKQWKSKSNRILPYTLTQFQSTYWHHKNYPIRIGLNIFAELRVHNIISFAPTSIENKDVMLVGLWIAYEILRLPWHDYEKADKKIDTTSYVDDFRKRVTTSIEEVTRCGKKRIP